MRSFYDISTLDFYESKEAKDTGCLPAALADCEVGKGEVGRRAPKALREGLT